MGNRKLEQYAPSNKTLFLGVGDPLIRYHICQISSSAIVRRNKIKFYFFTQTQRKRRMLFAMRYISDVRAVRASYHEIDATQRSWLSRYQC
jgi:hypothetical protein